jgi:hypothetical protein
MALPCILTAGLSLALLFAGPVMLRKVLNEIYPGKVSSMTRGSGPEEVHILGPDKIFPFNWKRWGSKEERVCVPPPGAMLTAQGSSFDREACKALFPGAYAISYWTHTWSR